MAPAGACSDELFSTGKPSRGHRLTVVFFKALALFLDTEQQQASPRPGKFRFWARLLRDRCIGTCQKAGSSLQRPVSCFFCSGRWWEANLFAASLSGCPHVFGASLAVELQDGPNSPDGWDRSATSFLHMLATLRIEDPEVIHGICVEAGASW